MNEVKIIRNGQQISNALVSESEWAAINYVDYIEVDGFDRVTPEFVHAHGLNTVCRMQKIVGAALDDSGAMTLPWVVLGIVGYLMYHLIASGVFQALTALQGVR